jgi:hypothetical protein
MDHTLLVQIEDEKIVDDSSETSFGIYEKEKPDYLKNNHEKAFLRLANNCA